MSGEASKPLSGAALWGGVRSPFSMSYGKLMIWFFLVSDALTFTGLLSAYGYARHSLGPGMAWPIGEEVFNSFPGLSGSYPLMYVALMTFILIISSVTMVLAVEAGHRMDKKGVVKWLFLTVLGGLFFLGSQAFEWSHFIHGSHARATLADGRTAYLAENPHHGASIDPATFAMTIGSPSSQEVVNGPEAYKLYQNAVHVTSGANMTENEYGPPAYANFFFFITGFHGFHVTTGVILNLVVLVQAVKGVFHRRGHYEMVEKAGLYWHFVDLVWVFVFTFFYLV
ncbi:MAG: cytochrome c oxidase subunit 3 [Flavobacteriales bacterium]|nr:cytochrome c oxidase subunit 3 [Flavobacteriales bacterium]MBP9080581.1 cytochrome c oxidase subunit 3 [Flavobacteriales bacterium]